jgi:hypothetical protein
VVARGVEVRVRKLDSRLGDDRQQVSETQTYGRTQGASDRIVHLTKADNHGSIMPRWFGHDADAFGQDDTSLCDGASLRRS